MSNQLPATAEDSVGPYYPVAFMDDDRTDLTRFDGLSVTARGDAVTLEGTVFDCEHRPVAPILLEFWQADAAGRFRTARNRDDPTLDPLFDGVSRQYCTAGSFRLRTVKPGPVYPPEAGGAPRAPHVTLSIFCDGISRVATQIFFEGEPLNETDPLLISLPEALRARLVARRVGFEDAVPRYAIDIVLRGEDETPFFDDLTT